MGTTKGEVIDILTKVENFKETQASETARVIGVSDVVVDKGLKSTLRASLRVNLGDEHSALFWQDRWCGDLTLEKAFPSLAALSRFPSPTVDIWEERKVFGSRGQVLKEEILGRNSNSLNRNGKNTHGKLKESVGEVLEKLVSNYECVYEGPVDEETLLGKCQNAVGSVEKVEKEIGGNFMLGNINGSQVVEELKGQSDVLRECIEQLKVAESSRMSLVSYLREALHEQELKLEQVRNQLQAAQFRVEQAGSICQQIMVSNNGVLPTEQRSKETGTFSDASPATGEKEQSAPVKYVQEPFLANSTHTEEHRKTAAAAVAAKLTASTSSAEMLSYVLSSLASEGVIRQQMKEDFSDSKRPKLDNGLPFMPSQVSQLPSHFPHADTFQQAATSQPHLQHSSSPMAHPGPSLQPPPPPPPSQPPMPPPPPPTQYMQAAGSMTAVPYTYGSALPQRPPLMPSFPISSPRPGGSTSGGPSSAPGRMDALYLGEKKHVLTAEDDPT
ncbi:hypothetical protein Taro_037615 [Colocasia esculenta]|uniref:Uncharacterized protein n=1 Tax=Colocasia esculenta TaxID=4460 RepID=A0A843WJT5_COLES|nr:hypothetical protein [Colocasia esculenta]